VIEIVLERELAEEYREMIEQAAPGRVAVLGVQGNHANDPDISGAEIAVSGWHRNQSVRFTDILAQMPQLRWIHSTGAGIDDFASLQLVDRGVWVTNVAGAYAPAMAEYALAAMIMLGRGFPAWLTAQREHRWVERVAPAGHPLHGRQVGIVGYGAVGRHLATACRAIGMSILATRRTPMFTAGEPIDRLLASEDLPLLLSESDFVVLAASLNSTTRNLIGAAELAAMKPTAFLINVSRGSLVDQAALATALGAGRLAGAALDVMTPEPLPPKNPLWELPNVIVTPHVSGDTAEGWRLGMEFFAANVRRYVDGHPERMGNLVDLRAHL
jgi:phosphoglycerate dehydrogenase-like enzyme